MRRIKSFNVYQTAKVVAIIYFVIIAIFMIPFGLFFSILGAAGSDSFPGLPFAGIIFVFLPFVYGGLSFVMTAIGCLLYNFVAGRFGGIEVEIETDEVTVAPPAEA
jgi:hypothetical protein